MLGEDFEEEFDTNKNDLLMQKSKSNMTEYLDLSTNRSRDGKKERSKKRKKKSCENCKALCQKINELEQLNEELLKIKEKLSKANEELTTKNEELQQTNKSLINQNKELTSANKQLKEENNELNKERNGYKTEISGLKKQLLSKVSTVQKDKDTTPINDISGNNNKDNNKMNVMNADLLSLNSDSIPPKKEDISSNRNETNTNTINNFYDNSNKYCTMDDFNELKNIVEELKEKISNLEKWKKNFGKTEKPQKKSKDRVNIFTEYDRRENSIKHEKKDSKKIGNDNLEDKLSRSLVLDQRMKNNLVAEINSTTNSINKSLTKKDKDNKKNKDIEKIKSKNQKFNSKIITNVEDLDLIARGLVKDDLDSLKNLRVGYKLIYRASEHGDDAGDFHERCDDYEGSLVIIKTKDGNIFGGYTSVSWDPDDEAEKKDECAFVFSLNLDKLYFESGDKEYSIFCDKNKGPCFVGMFAVQEHILKSKSYINPWKIQCFSGENSNYEINQGKSDFFIEELEVFQVIVKKS